MSTPLLIDDCSQRYDRAAALMLEDLLDSAKHSDLLLPTEVGGTTSRARSRKAALHKVPGFDVHQDTAHGDADEIATLNRAAVWKVLHYEAAILGPDLGPGGREIAGILVLEHTVTGVRLLASKAHLPATVEADFFHTARGRAHQACVQVWRARVKVLAARFDVDAQIVFADWNLNLHKPWVRAWIADAWPELDLPPAALIPDGGTHADDRLIDWFLYTGLVVESWKILRATAASDHRRSRVRASIPDRKEKHMAVAPPSPEFIPARWHGHDDQQTKAVVIHGAVTPDDPGTARAVAKDFATTSVKKSAHYTVDPKEVIQSVWDHTVAYHCGYNEDSIAVELCDEQSGPASRWQDADSQAIMRRAAALVARLCLAYDIEIKRPTIAELKAKGPHGIYGHNDSRLAFGHTTHTDPRDFPWDAFLAMVKLEAARLRGEPPATVAYPAPTVHITRFAESKSSAVRRKEARLIVERGDAKARKAAQAYLDADRARINAAKALKALEVK